MTDKSAAAAREIVERWMGKKHPITMQSYVSDLTALISEHYYPKEFTEWAIGLGRSAFDDRYYHYISVQNPNMPFKETKELEFDDLDDAFNYWKENER